MINKINTTNIKSNQRKKILTNVSTKLYNHKHDIIKKGLDWGYLYCTKKILESSILNKFAQINTLKLNSINNIQNAARHAIENNKKLKQSNLQIIYLNKENFEKLPPELQKNSHVEMVKEGYNAAFLVKSNKILLPEKKMQLSVFHEIGHAINYNCSTFWKNLFKFSKHSSTLMYSIFGAKLFNKTKTQEKSSSKKDAFICSAVMLPNLSEEALASIKGNCSAKKLVDKDIYKKILKNNRLSFLAYIIEYGFIYITFKMIFDLKNLIQKK